MQSGFRTDIQTLRGVAVSLVLLYHANLGLFSAGFLGVDVFFVISGFLITSLIKKEIDQGTFRFSEFYFRRAKRLLPAAYATFLCSTIAAPFILNAKELQDFSGQVAGAVTFTANVVLFFQSGYFAGAAELKPLLHTWSLSIEEQYYLLLPAFLVFVPRRFWWKSSLFLFLASLGLCLVLVSVKPIATFYLLPMRGWELGIGSLAAICRLDGVRARAVFKWLFWPSVVVLFIVPVWPTNLPHPGGDAMLVCVATIVVILRRHPFLDRSLISRGLAKVGDISYSLYLAHWPPFAFLKNAAVGPVTMQQNVLTLVVGIVLAWLLYRFVELPTRRLQIHPSRRFVFSGLAASLCVIGVPLAVAKMPVTGQDFVHVRRANDGFAAECAFETDFTPKEKCRNSDHPSLMVWGDSYAMHLVGGVVASWDHGVIQATRGNCGPFANLAPLSRIFYLHQWAESCLSFNRSVLDYLEKNVSVRVVVISSPFRQYLTPFDGKHHWRTLSRSDQGLVEQEVNIENAVFAMNETIRHIRKLGRQVVLVAPPPSAGFNIGACYERRSQGKWVVGAPTDDCSVPKDDYQRLFALTLEFLARVRQETGVSVVSLDPVLCDERRCASELDGTLIYVDGGHLTHDASSLLAKRIDLRTVLQNAPAGIVAR